MVYSLREALSPLLSVACFLGLAVFEQPLGRLRVGFSSVYIATIWTLYCCLLYYVYVTFPRNSLLGVMLTILIPVSNVFVAIISAILNVYYCQTFQKCLNSLTEVDDTLLKLGYVMNYGKAYKEIFKFLALWCVVSFALNFMDAMWEMEHFETLSVVIVPYVTNYALHVNTIVDMMFLVLLRFTGSRFDRVNESIQSLSDDKGKWISGSSFVVRNRRDPTEIEKRKHIIRTVMHLHLQLCKISHDLNKMFQIQMCLEMASYFVVVLLCSVYSLKLLLIVMQGGVHYVNDLITQDLWSLLYIVKLICLNYICETVSEKAQLIKVQIVRLLASLDDEEMREDIFQFSFQLKQKPLKFSGLGLFNFGYDFIKRFFISQTTVVIIILQMTMTSRNQHNAKSRNKTDTE